MVAARDDFGIMGGKHERAAVRRDAQQPGQHEFASDGILLGGRLVGDEQLHAVATTYRPPSANETSAQPRLDVWFVAS
jgi:hypothetical protein